MHFTDPALLFCSKSPWPRIRLGRESSKLLSPSDLTDPAFVTLAQITAVELFWPRAGMMIRLLAASLPRENDWLVNLELPTSDGKRRELPSQHTVAGCLVAPQKGCSLLAKQHSGAALRFAPSIKSASMSLSAELARFETVDEKSGGFDFR